MTVKLYEVEPGRWRVKRRRGVVQRAENMPLPFVISDTMPELEQVDGRFYTSKRAFRAVGRALGLTEVGNEKVKPKQRGSTNKAFVEKRRQAIAQSIEQVKAGVRSR